jgi:hypothetical protein
MKVTKLVLLAIAGACIQLNAQSPPLTAPLPAILQQLERRIAVSHFPSPVHAVTIEEVNQQRYVWKHNTSVMSPYSDVQIESCGAYIFYNGQWNLRVEYDAKDFSKLFDCPQGTLLMGQPYTFIQNWRFDMQLRAGWALWYFIGRDAHRNKVMGFARLETTDLLVPDGAFPTGY